MYNVKCVITKLGPPSQPQVIYMRENYSVCFTAYSNPTLQVIYAVTVSMKTAELYFFLNDSQCIDLSSVDLDDPTCSPLEIVVTATNMLGESNNTENITRGKCQITVICLFFIFVL